MDNIITEVTRQYLDQYCGIDYYIGRKQAELAVTSTCLARLGKNVRINSADLVIQHTSTVWFVIINGDVVIGTSHYELNSRLEYRGIILPEELILSCPCELWLIDRPSLDCHIAIFLNEMSNLDNHNTSADNLLGQTS